MPNKDFTKFQEHFKKYQHRFGLMGYQVYFKYEPIDVFADITCNLTNMIATVRLNSKLPEKDKPYKGNKRTAKHEAIHLLIMRLENNARYRYSTDVDITESVEELTIKLEELIGD